ncbi:MAG: hypothetical protein R3E01_19805 [Pirellulaceae bacterium]
MIFESVRQEYQRKYNLSDEQSELAVKLHLNLHACGNTYREKYQAGLGLLLAKPHRADDIERCFRQWRLEEDRNKLAEYRAERKDLDEAIAFLEETIRERESATH